ncbi:MAG TPA: hypothetical protein VIF62_36635 [Labilithrix sp.]|jgi:hypothetical protein
MNQTTRRRRVNAAMIIGLDAAVAEAAQTMLRGLGYQVVRVGHAAAASERLPVLMPILVVASAETVKVERESLEDGAVAVGAHVVWLPPNAEAVQALLAHTARQVLEAN